MAVSSCTGSLFWLKVDERILTSPWLGRDFDGRTFQDFAFDPKFVAWTHRATPADFVAGADDAPGGFEIPGHQQPHGQGGGVQAAGGEAAKERNLGRLLVQAEGLRVELVSMITETGPQICIEYECELAR